METLAYQDISQVVQTLEQRKNIGEHPLAQKITYLRNNWQQEGLPHNWYDLPQTGFWVEAEMNQLPGEWTNHDLSHWLLNRVKPDVQGYTLEYLYRTGVFPIQYDLHRQSDGMYLTAPMYGGKKLLDVINPKERNGALVEAIEGVTAFFAKEDTPDGSIAVITSVRGKSGMTDPDSGKEIVFPDSQRYLLQKRGDTFVGFTIRTDAQLEEERAFIQELTGQKISSSAQPEDYVRAVTYIRADDTTGKPKTFEEVVSVMESVHKRTHAFFDPKDNTTITWQDIYTDLQREDLWRFPDTTGMIFEEFREFAMLVDTYVADDTSRHYARRLIQEGLAATILEISRYVQGNKQSARRIHNISVGQDVFVTPQAFPASYGLAIKKMQATGGCSKSEDSGGLGEVVVDSIQKFINSITPRLGDTMVEDYTKDTNLCRCGGESAHFHCPGKKGSCKAVIVVGKGISECPSCGEGKKC